MPDVHYLEPPQRGVNRPSFPQIDLTPDDYGATRPEGAAPFPARFQRAAAEDHEPIVREIPAKLALEGHRLANAYEQVEAHRKMMDGAIFGFVGLDACTAFIPGVNPIINAYSMLLLTSIAVRVKAGFRTILFGIWLMLIDMAVGVVFGVGDLVDVFWRSSAWYGKLIENRIEERIFAIARLEELLEKRGYLTQSDITAVEDEVFRNGKSAAAVMIGRLLVVAGIGFVLFQLFA